MRPSKLFLICPDCYIESKIKEAYKGDIYFLTALGGVFDISEFSYAESLHLFMTEKAVEEIYIVNDCCCRFIESSLSESLSYHTFSEKVIQRLVINNPFEVLVERDDRHRAKVLARLNIKRQADALRSIPFLGNKIGNNELKVKGLLFDRNTDRFLNISV